MKALGTKNRSKTKTHIQPKNIFILKKHELLFSYRYLISNYPIFFLLEPISSQFSLSSENNFLLFSCRLLLISDVCHGEFTASGTNFVYH